MTVGRLRFEFEASPDGGAREFRDWMTYSRLMPFKDEREFRADARMALLCSLYVNSKRKKGTTAADIKDFMISWRPRKVAREAKSPEELYAKSQALLPLALAAARSRRET